jgi:hypothetical protein
LRRAIPLVALAVICLGCLPHAGPTPPAPPVTAAEPPRPPDPPRTEPAPRPAPKTEPAAPPAVKKPTRATPELQAERKKKIEAWTSRKADPGQPINRIIPTEPSVRVEESFWHLPEDRRAEILKTVFEYVYSLPAEYRPEDVFPGAVLWVDNTLDQQMRTYTAEFGVQQSDGRRHPDRVKPTPPAGWMPPD